MILFLPGLQRISPELYEAAAVDGARNAWQTFRYITFPQLRATSVAVLLLLLINAYLAFDEFFNLLDNSSFARPLLVYLSAVTFIPSFIIVSQLRWVRNYQGIIASVLFSGFPRRVGGGPREGIVNVRLAVQGKVVWCPLGQATRSARGPLTSAISLLTGEMRSLMSGTGWPTPGTGPPTTGRRSSTSGNGSWTPAPRSLAVPLKSLERRHSGPRPVPDGRRRD
jgi:hypothetical protein